MKAKLFFEKVLGITGTKDEALTKALENAAFADVELGDEIVKDFDAKLLTRDRAENDPTVVEKITKKVRSEVFDNVDGRLKEFYAMIEKEDADDIGNTFLTYEKIEKLSKGVKKALDKAKTAGNTDDVKALTEKLNKLQEEKADEIKRLQADSKEALTKKEQELKEKNLDFILKSKIFGIEFAKEYANDRESIVEFKIAKLKKENILSLDEDGTTIKVQHSKDGVVMDKYNGTNEKVTADSLIKAEFDSFTKKNNSGSGKEKSDGDGKSKEREQTTGRETLAELRAKRLHTTSVNAPK